MDNLLSHRESKPTQVSVPITSPPATVALLSDVQQLALEWLLSGGSITEAAKYAGVCRQTVSAWLHDDPDFKGIYENWRMQTASVIQGRMAAISETAMDNLCRAIREEGDLRASQFVIRSLATKQAG